MLAGVHYSLSLAFMLRDARQHQAPPVRAMIARRQHPEIAE